MYKYLLISNKCKYSLFVNQYEVYDQYDDIIKYEIDNHIYYCCYMVSGHNVTFNYSIWSDKFKYIICLILYLIVYR